MIDISDNIVGNDNASYLQYLRFLQDVITRMNRNAFQLKGWCIAIVTALAALEVKTGAGCLLVVASFVVLPFGFLDGYYLLTERRFRGLYKDVINGRSDIKLFEMSISRYTKQHDSKYGYRHVLCSSSVCGFYIPLLSLCVAGWFACMFIGNKNVSHSQHNASQCVLLQHKYPAPMAVFCEEEAGLKCREETFHWNRKRK